MIIKTALTMLLSTPKLLSSPSLPLFLLLLLLLFLFFFLLTTIHLLHRLLSLQNLPPSLPWAGCPPNTPTTPFSRAKANLKSFFSLKDLLEEGYSTYSKPPSSSSSSPWVLPYFLNGPEVHLPPSRDFLSWLLTQPDDVLSQDAVNRQFLEAEHTFLHATKMTTSSPVHPEIIRHQLTKGLGRFTGDLVDEMEVALEEEWGGDEGEGDGLVVEGEEEEEGKKGQRQQWKEVNVYETMLNVIARLSIRVFMGKPWCRDEEFLAACKSFNRKVALSAAGISLFPGFLKPLVAPLFTFYDYIQYRRCRRLLMPTIRQRLAEAGIQRAAARKQKLTTTTGHDDDDKLPLFDSPSSFPSKEPPDDYIQWAISHALSSSSSSSSSPLSSLNSRSQAKETENLLNEDLIAIRFSILCFAAIQSSVITLTNTLFDLAACFSSSPSSPSPQSTNPQQTIRNEILSTILSSPPSSSPFPSSSSSSKITSQSQLRQLHHLDSSIRESLRLNGFVQRGVLKMVVSPGGVDIPIPIPIPIPLSSSSSTTTTTTKFLHLKQGTKVGISGYNVHRDESFYNEGGGGEDPGRYDPFRFVVVQQQQEEDDGDKIREDEEPEEGTTTSTTSKEKEGEEIRKRKQQQQQRQSLVSTSSSFMGFSHGSHACPGRFFAANQLKIALATILLNYDIDTTVHGDGKRPENKWFFGHIAPPLDAKLRVRRRQR